MSEAYQAFLRESERQELFEIKRGFKWKRSDRGKWREARNLYTITRVENGWELRDEQGKVLGRTRTLPEAQNKARSHWYTSGSATSSSTYNARLERARQISPKISGVSAGSDLSSVKKVAESLICEELSDTAQELELFIRNEYDLWVRQRKGIIQNLMKKRAAGTYNPLKAEKIFMYLVDAGAKLYSKGEDRPWNKRYPMNDRKQLAASFAKNFEQDAQTGEFDKYIPKKYQKKVAESTNEASGYDSGYSKKLDASHKKDIRDAASFLTKAQKVLLPASNKSPEIMGIRKAVTQTIEDLLAVFKGL